MPKSQLFWVDLVSARSGGFSGAGHGVVGDDRISGLPIANAEGSLDRAVNGIE